MATQQIRLKLSENGRVVILERQKDGYRLTTRRQRIREAQETIRRYIKPGVSLVDELIAERREAAKHE